MSHEVLVRLCPDCGGHLADTWDRDAEECANCGFAYVRFTRSTTSTATSTSDPVRPMKRTTAGVFAVMTAALAGAGIANTEVVTTVPTETGAEAITFSPPDASFWFAFGLLFVATLLVAYATGGDR